MLVDAFEAISAEAGEGDQPPQRMEGGGQRSLEVWFAFARAATLLLARAFVVGWAGARVVLPVSASLLALAAIDFGLVHVLGWG